MSQASGNPAQPGTVPFIEPAVFRFSPQEPWPGSGLETPAVLQELGTKAERLFGLQELDVTVAGLALLASALGRWQAVDDGRVKIPPAFNVLFLPESNLGSAWMDYLGKDWLVLAGRLEQPDQAALQEAMMKGMETSASRRPTREAGGRPDGNGHQPSPEMMHFASFGRRLICRELNPVSLSEAIVWSRDFSVTILNGAPDDPLAEWMALPKASQEVINGMLKSSWKGLPVKLPGQSRRAPATLNLVGITRRDALQAFLNKPAFRSNPLPILFVRQRGPGKRFPDLGGPEFERWSQLLRGAHRCRIQSPAEACSVLGRDETALAEQFFSAFRDALKTLPPAMVPYLEWIPELVLRLYILMNIRDARPDSSPSDEAFSGSAMKSALLLTRWLAQEHYAVLQEFMQGSGADREGPQADVCSVADNADRGVSADKAEMDALKQSILDRLARTGPMTPREVQRSFHLLNARMRDEAIRSLKLAGEIVESAGGRITLPV